MEGKGAIASIAAIVKHLGYQPNSVGHLSACCQKSGQALPLTVSMTSQTLVFSRREEIVALHAPLVVTIEPHSIAIFHIELATDRSASTWKAHVDTRKDHHFHSRGMASDRGLGLVAGSRDAGPEALWGETTCMRFEASALYVYNGRKKPLGPSHKQMKPYGSGIMPKVRQTSTSA